MNEEQIVKKALKDEYVKEIVQKWIDDGSLEKDEVSRDDKGTITFVTNKNLVEVVTDLTYKLAETKAEFWWKTNIQKDNENKEKRNARAEEIINQIEKESQQ